MAVSVQPPTRDRTAGHRTKKSTSSVSVTPVSEPQPIDPSIINRPNDLSSVPSLLSAIFTQGIAAVTSPSDDATRLALLSSARALVLALESPRETMLRQCWADTVCMATLSIGVDTGVWAYLGRDDRPKRVADIAAATGFEAAYLARLLKHVAAMGHVIETGKDEYKPTNFSKALAIPTLGAAYPLFTGPGNTGGVLRCTASFPSYLKSTNLATPTSITNSNTQFAFDTPKNFFELCHDPAYAPMGAQFNTHMGSYAFGRPTWVDEGFYPIGERLLEGFDDEDETAALLVDIGGSIGHDLQKFRDAFPEAKGRLVLQDLEPVVAQVKETELDASIERMAYDFLTEQPVKGARAYYMHSVLHDWPDHQCVPILENVKAAMKPGYSRLLINENVIPDVGASWESTSLDIMMSCLVSSKERTKDEWVQLLKRDAGLKITGFYPVGNGVESIIECELPSKESESSAEDTESSTDESL
ncbi:hypothetical protein NEUTE1DRAFT_68062 [Neurospora tetrasperma FGSC 2508]|uniref:O-methyltransferase C-terminal domain-containing protein n=1 Tax=Neurospora tetrasperma (strain FGSC 2508 / ATCC MYA-4615 / P0657) TaxID=510951 RepID=F8MST7_NEUT8|nr:uncharacterized protein NEUTE1DRAFT_68062 [Neurospora tetrasperma FGSC 2508]EGO55973.1 hypothetical protein NEUTE1DRAFT_68062 [Neurospora tetrasperma FGSC 2508]EGZ68766.1 S-adenosyl-L-methionine-dependent methyltransferase [Neurospora tetrasperma FGSC 2509]